MSELISFT